MKQCPTCQSQYTDDTLQFCLQDGSPLRFVAGSREEEGATLAFNEQETVVSGRKSEQIATPPLTNPTDWNPNQFQTNNAAVATPEKKSGTTAAIFATAFVMLLLFSFVGIGAWLYFRGVSNDPNKNILLAKREETDAQNANRSSVAVRTPQPMATYAPKTAGNANVATNAAPVDKEQIRRDVSQQVNSWKSGTESGNIDSYINLYADRLDYYYTKRGVSRSAVRSDKQNAFSQFSDIQMNVGNLTVTPDESGEKATAVFDKEWVFSGAKRFAGKAQSQLQFKKVNGTWLIVGERDLKVY